MCKKCIWWSFKLPVEPLHYLPALCDCMNVQSNNWWVRNRNVLVFRNQFSTPLTSSIIKKCHSSVFASKLYSVSAFYFLWQKTRVGRKTRPPSFHSENNELLPAVVLNCFSVVPLEVNFPQLWKQVIHKIISCFPQHQDFRRNSRYEISPSK